MASPDETRGMVRKLRVYVTGAFIMCRCGAAGDRMTSLEGMTEGTSTDCWEKERRGLGTALMVTG